MKFTIKRYCAAIVLLSCSLYLYNSDILKNDKSAYQLASTAAHNYFNYHHQKGATSQSCSPEGQQICAILATLEQRTRAFSHSARQDLALLSRDAARSFKIFDQSGNEVDRKMFVRSLANLLQAIVPLLNEQEASECLSLIKKLNENL